MFKYQFSLNGFKIRLLPNVCMLCGAEGLIKKKKKKKKKKPLRCLHQWGIQPETNFWRWITIWSPYR